MQCLSACLPVALLFRYALYVRSSRSASRCTRPPCLQASELNLRQRVRLSCAVHAVTRRSGHGHGPERGGAHPQGRVVSVGPAALGDPLRDARAGTRLCHCHCACHCRCHCKPTPVSNVIAFYFKKKKGETGVTVSANGSDE